MSGGIHCSVMTTIVNWVLIHGIDIGGAIIESVAAVEVEEHGEEAIVTEEAETPRDCRILEALLVPLDKDVAQSQDLQR
jgi:hypothetical protein